MTDRLGNVPPLGEDRVEDDSPVRSRISWGAILGGAMVALALYFLLTLLGAAIGLSISGGVKAETVGMAAAVWAIVATIISLFVGGYVTTQCTVGENRFESVLYGIILWGVLFGMLLWLMASGIQTGFTALVGMTQASQGATEELSTRGWEWAAKKAGVPQGKIEEWRSATAAEAREAAAGPDAQKAEEAATRVTWWAFAGALLSVLAAVGGAYAGTGPQFRMASSPFVMARGDGSLRARPLS